MQTRASDLRQALRGSNLFGQRVSEVLTSELHDDAMRWSLDRLESLAPVPFVQKESPKLKTDWGRLGVPDALRDVDKRDFDGSPLAWPSILKLLEATVQREEHTSVYAFASAHTLRGFSPRVAQFMGRTLEDRILEASLFGGVYSGQSVWVREEQSHAPLLAKIYAKLQPDGPAVTRAGVASRKPEVGERATQRMVFGRNLAELAGAGAYMILKANARSGSPSDRALSGIFLDEIYHFVVMSALEVGLYGKRTALHRLAVMSYDFLRVTRETPLATSNPERPEAQFGSDLGLYSLYALIKITRRIGHFMKTISREDALKLVAPSVDTAFRAANVIVPASEANPDLSSKDLSLLAREYPTYYSFNRRTISTHDVDLVTKDFRERHLANLSFWTTVAEAKTTPGQKRFELSLSSGALLLNFGSNPQVSVRSESGAVLLQEDLLKLSMRQVGVLVRAVMPSQTPAAAAVVENLRKYSEPQTAAQTISDLDLSIAA